MIKHFSNALLKACAIFAFSTAAHAQSLNPLPPVPNKDVAIWWKPMQWGLPKKRIDYAVHDFPAVLTTPSEWVDTRADIRTFELQGNLVWSYPVSPGGGPLSNVVHWINRHPTKKITLGSGFVANGGKCGVGFEGESADPVYNVETATIAQEWQKAGGRMDYMVMDSPLLYARIPVSEGGCGWSIQQAAENVSKTIHKVLKYYPDVKIIDAAGPAFEPTANWLSDMQKFHSELAALGTPVWATEIDEGWNSNLNGQTWTEVVSQSVPFFHMNGERVGLFLNSDYVAAGQASDAAFMAQYVTNAQVLVSCKCGEDWVAVESWNSMMPQHNLPESDRSTFSSIVPLLSKLLRAN